MGKRSDRKMKRTKRAAFYKNEILAIALRAKKREPDNFCASRVILSNIISLRITAKELEELVPFRQALYDVRQEMEDVVRACEEEGTPLEQRVKEDAEELLND